MNNVDFPPAPEPSREPIPDIEVNHNPEIQMPDNSELTPLTEAERSDLCALLERSQVGAEELSDLILEGLTQRIAQAVNDVLPWWARWVPIPVGILRDKLDEYFPEIILDPVRDALGCPTSSQGGDRS